jgi:hypothetical protein
LGITRRNKIFWQRYRYVIAVEAKSERLDREALEDTAAVRCKFAAAEVPGRFIDLELILGKYYSSL